MSSRKSGFTLIELLVVIGIIGVLAGLILPGIMGASTEGAKVECISRQSQIYKAMIRYANAHGQSFPWAGENKKPWEHLQILVDKGYLKEPALFIHKIYENQPAKKDAKKKFKLSDTTCSWTTYDKPISLFSDDDRVVLCSRSINPGFKNGYVVTYKNSSTKFIEEDQLPKGIINLSGTEGTSTGTSTGGDNNTNEPVFE